MAPQDEYLKGMLSSGKLGWYVSVCEGGNDDWGEAEGMCMVRRITTRSHPHVSQALPLAH